MNTNKHSQSRRLTPFFSIPMREDPKQVLIDIYSDYSLEDIIEIMTFYFVCTQHMEDELLEYSRPSILMSYMAMIRLIRATYEMARPTGQVPDFNHESPEN